MPNQQLKVLSLESTNNTQLIFARVISLVSTSVTTNIFIILNIAACPTHLQILLTQQHYSKHLQEFISF